MTTKPMTAERALEALHTETAIVEWVLPSGTAVLAGSAIASVRITEEGIAVPVLCDQTGVITALPTTPTIVTKDDAIVMINYDPVELEVVTIPKPPDNMGTQMQKDNSIELFRDFMRGFIAGLDSVPTSHVDDAYVARKLEDADRKEEAFAKEKGLKKVDLPRTFDLI